MQGDNSDNIVTFPPRRASRKPQVPGPEEQGPGEQGPAPEPVLNLPTAIKGIALSIAAMFLAVKYLPGVFDDKLIYALCFVPLRYTGEELFTLAALTSPFTHVFLHFSWMHVLFNLMTLIAFGSGVEKTLGARRLLFLFFASALAGALLHALLNAGSWIPLAGASGGISGLFGVILLLMRKGGMMTGAAFWIMTGLWIGISFLFGMTGVPGQSAQIAWAAHVGGFLAGLSLAKSLIRQKIP